MNDLRFVLGVDLDGRCRRLLRWTAISRIRVAGDAAR